MPEWSYALALLTVFSGHSHFSSDVFVIALAVIAVFYSLDRQSCCKNYRTCYKIQRTRGGFPRSQPEMIGQEHVICANCLSQVPQH